MSKIKILSAKETKAILSMEDVINSVKEVYADKANGSTEVFPLVFHEFDPGKADMDIKSGWVKGANAFGLKLVSWFGENPSKGLPALAGTVVVCDDQTGMPIGLLDGAHLTGIRTGAAGALGIKYLGREDSNNLLLIGAGHVATFQVAATLILCPQIKTIRVYDPMSLDNARKFVNSLKELLKEECNYVPAKDVVFEVVEDIESATKESHNIITVTPARSPIIMSDWVQPGTHISCIGADMSGKQEIDGNILKKSKVFVDDLEQNCNVGEIEIPIQEGLIQKEDILGELGHVINKQVKGRESAQDITVYDATGTALLDIAVGKLALEISREKGIGVEVSL